MLGAAAALAAGLGVGLWLGLRGGDKPEPTRQQYLARVSSVCRSYGRRLERVAAPSALGPRLDRLFTLNRRSIAELEAALAAARRRRAGGVATGLVRFSTLRDQVHGLAVAIGIGCNPN